jgi:hypothetical protein
VTGRRLLVALALIPLAAVAANGDEAPVVVSARAEPYTVTVGARFRYIVEITARPETEIVAAQPAERIGDFDIVDFALEPARLYDGKTVVTRTYTLVGWSPGHHLVKSPPVQYRAPGEGLREAAPHEMGVTVESLLGEGGAATDIRDIKGPEEVPVDWRPYWLAGGAVLVLAAAALVLHRVLGRSRQGRPAPLPPPPEEVARAELERLRARGLVGEGAFKEYYSALSGIVRTYLEQRFRLRAPEMTTEEFLLATTRDGRLQVAHRRLLGEFLAESDLVKFARHLPTIADSERAYEAARRFVDESAPAPAPREERHRAAG